LGVPYEGTPKPGELYKTFLGVVTGRNDDKNTLEISVGAVKGIVKLADFERYNPQKLPASQFAEEGAHVRVSFLGSLPDPANTTPPPVPLRLELGAESALVAIDPRTHEVLALIGSYEGAAGGLDRATQTKRQPGSTFKPVLYSYALHAHKVTPATLVDASTPPQATYKNVNQEDVSSGQKLRLREGLAKSVNPVAIQVMKDAGPDNVVAWAKELGVTAKLGADLSLALGAYEVAPIEMAGIYTTFAAGGMYQAPRLLTKIVGPDGKERPLPPVVEPRRVMTDAEAYLMTNMLTSVITSGTGAKAREIGRVAAGKTGTTNQAKDTWFVGYTPEIVCAVWTGYDEPKPLGGGKEAGATAALPAWISFMKGAHDKKPSTDFPRPVGLSVVKIDPESGLRAWDGQENALDEIFLAGTEPTETAVQGEAGGMGGMGAGAGGAAADSVPAIPGGVGGAPSTLPALPP
jgi:penicillin-binding protein 1A